MAKAAKLGRRVSSHDHITAFQEVTEVRRTYGEVDYLIRVEVADSDAYERFQGEQMYALSAVRRIVPHPTMKFTKSP
ncbi:Lrp/AsnC ligand binding domain-containing protein [Actinotalea sp. K2]|uniref:Lrp/AsnC ligand binding domain-containing protein n=1 Tax=Actinotalea sp. K2 TaxID=2939438 RepID=UPI0020176B7C|nr:Lrp/AsnC ligand binding domain-containing protein [Actinotalea sp. K2]MCL3860643.1 Lrp/AsnC ligand binding domain-containing protein [Actinotalea sp. K2]